MIAHDASLVTHDANAVIFAGCMFDVFPNHLRIVAPRAAVFEQQLLSHTYGFQRVGLHRYDQRPIYLKRLPADEQPRLDEIAKVGSFVRGYFGVDRVLRTEYPTCTPAEADQLPPDPQPDERAVVPVEIRWLNTWMLIHAPEHEQFETELGRELAAEFVGYDGAGRCVWTVGHLDVTKTTPAIKAEIERRRLQLKTIAIRAFGARSVCPKPSDTPEEERLRPGDYERDIVIRVVGDTIRVRAPRNMISGEWADFCWFNRPPDSQATYNSLTCWWTLPRWPEMTRSQQLLTVALKAEQVFGAHRVLIEDQTEMQLASKRARRDALVAELLQLDNEIHALEKQQRAGGA